MVDNKFVPMARMVLRHILGRAEANTYEPSNAHNPFVNLPIELVLGIATYLDGESKVLLSLSCKFLRQVLLNSHLNLSLSDLRTRTGFLQILERDHPEYLTCRVCGWMFLWRKRRFICYQCPRISRHSIEDRRGTAGFTVCRRHFVTMRQEMLDLVLRAHRKGPHYGLPISFLNSNYPAEFGTHLQTQARMVEGDLMLFSEWTLDIEADGNMSLDLSKLNGAMCLHRWHSVKSGLWPTVALKAHSIDCADGPVLHKCPVCATDFEVHLRKLEHGRFKVILQAWRDLGNGHCDSWAAEQMFRTHSTRRLCLDVLSQRDLKMKFATHGDAVPFTVSCQHRPASDSRMMDEQ